MSCPPLKGPACPTGLDPTSNEKVEWPGDLFTFGPGVPTLSPTPASMPMPPAVLELENKEPGIADKLKKAYHEVSVAEALRRSGAAPIPPKGSKPG